MEPKNPTPAETPAQAPPQPVSLSAAFHDLLTHPLAILERAPGTGVGPALALLAGSAVLWVLYGAAAGFFQGGTQILVAALKAPLIILVALLLCLPSLFVFSAMAGTRWTVRTFLAVLAGFAGTLAMVLLALLPVSWLFSASSRHLSTAMIFQFLLWVVGLVLSEKFLRKALAALGTRPSALALWMGLFLLVSLQVATMLRPVLLRKPGGGVFVTGKKSFLEQMWYVFDKDETVPLKKPAPAKTTKPATGKPKAGTPTATPKPGALTPGKSPAPAPSPARKAR
ncbi:MAG TPA: hypothetical protein VGS07_02355 [Thermoanaerobaculia bacterium]|nr:hypothetical protein [Thermoanaerobaculia bacterium]